MMALSSLLSFVGATRRAAEGLDTLAGNETSRKPAQECSIAISKESARGKH